MNGLIVRASTEADVTRCAEIYAHHVLHGTASFEIDPPDLGEMKKRRAHIVALGLPHLVAEREGRVLGYAYASNWRPRPAYAFSVEDSIYIDQDAVGQGVGRALLPVLAACGCGRSEATLRGRVTVQGKPLTTGTVLFLGSDNRVATGSIGPDGHYNIDLP